MILDILLLTHIDLVLMVRMIPNAQRASKQIFNWAIKFNGFLFVLVTEVMRSSISLYIIQKLHIPFHLSTLDLVFVLVKRTSYLGGILVS